MHLGRFTAGQFLRIPCHTLSNGHAPYAPPTAPRASIYDSTDAKLASFLMPPVDKGSVTGMFVYRLRLSSTYPAGHYRVAINYVANSVKQLKVAHFEVVAGGHADGAVVAMSFYPRPHANFLLERLDSNQRLIIKNPRTP